MSNKHIKESDEGLRHFSRHTKKCAKTSDADCDYESRYVGPFAPPSTFPKTGFGRHHVLPIGSVGKFETFAEYSEEDRAKIREVYRKTKWCTSREKNVIILPLKSEYSKDQARGLNLPCHNLDHNGARGYTDEVTSVVEWRIWWKFKKAVDGKGHPQPEDVSAALESLESEFRQKLITRGMRKGGTATALSIDRKAMSREEIVKSQWWLPFSMAKDNVAKQRVLLSLGNTPEWLKQKIRSRYAKKT